VEKATVDRKRNRFFAARIASLGALALSSIVGTIIYMARGKDPFSILRYYTTQSNIILAAVCVAEICILLRDGKAGKGFARLRQAAVIAIMVTGIVFSLFLAGKVRFMGWYTIGSFLSHYFSPFMAPVVWLIFSEKGHAHLRHAGFWLAYPLAYVAYALIQGALTGFYPYWFLNPSQPRPQGIGSYPGVAAFVAVMSASFVILGLLMVLADRALAKKPPATTAAREKA
jgi:hypothetical protein